MLLQSQSTLLSTCLTLVQLMNQVLDDVFDTPHSLHISAFDGQCWVLGVVDSKEVNNLLDLAGIQQGAAVSVPCGRRLTYTL